MVMVTESAVSAAVLLKRIACSLNQGPLALTSGVMVTPPVPPLLTVRLMGVLRDRLPLVPVTVRVAAPSVAVLDAVKVRVEVLPVVGVGLKLAVTPVGKPVAVKAT